MRLNVSLVLFALMLAAATSMSFLGYRYLSLASEYRHRNLIHMHLVHEAIGILKEESNDLRAVAPELTDKISDASREAKWCNDNLLTIEKHAFAWLGAAQALVICEQDVMVAQRAIDALTDFAQSESPETAAEQDHKALRSEIAGYLHRMHRHSIEFSPYVELIDQRLTAIVQYGTGIVSLFLAGLFGVLARHLVCVWRVQREQSHQINRMSQRSTAAFAAAPDGFALFDSEDRLLSCNDRYRELSHPDPDEVKIGMTVDEIFTSAARAGHYELHGRTPEAYLDAYHRHLSDADYRLDAQMELSGNRHIVSSVNKTDFGDTVVTRCDITELVRNEQEQRKATEALQEANNRIEAQALTDPLTQLPNRRHLDRELARRLSCGPVTLIRVDLDRFKKINDVLGHEAGDFVLCHVADVLREHTRKEDLTARVGGDEFVILCAPGSTLKDGYDLAERVLQAVLEPVVYGNKRCNYGASFGVAHGETGLMQPSELLSNADAALYRAKESGRGTVEIFTPEMRQEALAERALADRLNHALEAGEIVPFYQTQHDARHWHLAGVEVLARWQHPEMGVLSPDKFLGIAQQLGLEAELDGVIFEAAVKDMQELETHGIVVPRVAFNVSAPRIMQPSFLEAVRKRIPINRERYVFEILESISFEEEGAGLLFCIDALKDMGFKIDVDDFGSGHASINGVLNIEPHALKIDRNIILPLERSERAERMVASIVDLAQSLDVKIIAEGVDSAEKAHLLRQLGCNMLQGFFFSRPQSYSNFKASLLSLQKDNVAS